MQRWGDDWHELHARLGLAYQQIVGPLLASQDSGGIERGLDELEKTSDPREKPGELFKYLSHAVAAQEVLLRRPPAVRRIATPLPAAESKSGRAGGELQERWPRLIVAPFADWSQEAPGRQPQPVEPTSLIPIVYPAYYAEDDASEGIV